MEKIQTQDQTDQSFVKSLPASGILEDKQEHFHIVQFQTNCIAQFAYYVESDGEAAVIDPLRDYTPILQHLEHRKATLKYVFETHFHADFVSSHLDIYNKVRGATIVFGPTAQTNYQSKTGVDGEKFQLGKVTIELLHTPGHTPESASYVLINGDQKYCVFSGDCLFLGDVGRPDLSASDKITKFDLAGQLFDSLRNKIMVLPKTVKVYPGHGAGSACGKNIQSGTWDTLENQLKTNYALQEMSKEEFVNRVTSNIPAPPVYFSYDAKKNKQGYTPLEEVIKKSLKNIEVEEFCKLLQEQSDILILDTREPEEYVKAFIPNSLNVTLKTNFATWCGTLIAPETKLLLVTSEGQEYESIVRLARIGYESVIGCLKGGIKEWVNANKPINKQKGIDAKTFKAQLNEKPYILDVRKQGEFDDGHLTGAQLLTLSDIEAQLKANNNLIPKDKDIYIYCRSGYRSCTALSILAKFGYNRLINMEGGITSLNNEGIELIKQ